MTESSARALITDARASLLNDLYLHPSGFSVQFGNTVINSFSVPHDSAAAVGYTVEYTDASGTEKLGVATDIGHISDSVLSSLIGSDSVIIEANHDVEMLLSGPYPYSLKRRILSDTGHLSNASCAEAVIKILDSGTRKFILGHLSEHNNTTSLALGTTVEALGKLGAEAGTDYEICVAPLKEAGKGITL